jgi:hypothetical protein
MLINLHSNIISPRLGQSIINTFSLMIACAFLSNRPYLYTTGLDHVADDLTRRMNQGEFGQLSPEAYDVLEAVKGFAEGCFVGAAIGSRTRVCSCSHPFSSDLELTAAIDK